MNSNDGQQRAEVLETKLRNYRILSILLAVALVFIGVAYAMQWSSTKDGAGQQQPTSETPSAEEPDLSTAPYMVLGDDDAPVTIYEWTDYTCPYCGLYHRDTLPTVIKEYVDEGKVRIEVHDVTYIGEQAEDAAVAARSAGLQDRYFDYLFAVYGLSADGAKPNLDEAQLKELADGLDLDAEKFAADFASPELRHEVQSSTAQAQQLGISGVPFFIVSQTDTLQGAQQLNGAQEIDAFRSVIDQQLKTAGQ